MSKFHGVFSLILFFIALAIGIYSIAISNFAYGLSYLAIIVLGFVAIAGIFCSKCTCAPYNCSHVLIGYLTLLFPKRKSSVYSILDYLITIIFVALILAIPQYWLWFNKALFAAFWILLAIAGIEIYLFVCKACGNKLCAMCKNKHIVK